MLPEGEKGGNWGWGAAGYSLLVFVQRGLQEAEGIHQPCSKAQLLSRSAPEASTLRAVLVQIKLLLSLFADQLGLLGRTNFQDPPAPTLICPT